MTNLHTMKIQNVSFEVSAKDLKTCPSSSMPEFAFIGRSNVGKSSLINMLTGKKDLAKTSSTPGKTKLINFFKINDNWKLVDLPGYGYAKVTQGEKVVFNETVSEYLLERKNLKRIFLLIDCRNEPQLSDMEFVDWLDECELPYSIVFTKTDKVSNSTTTENMDHFLETLEEWEIETPQIFKSSSKTRDGRQQILKSIEADLPKAKKKIKNKTEKKSKDSISIDWMMR